jgi:hypothetical protein
MIIGYRLLTGVMPYVYAHTQVYSKEYKLGKEEGRSGGATSGCLGGLFV